MSFHSPGWDLGRPLTSCSGSDEPLYILKIGVLRPSPVIPPPRVVKVLLPRLQFQPQEGLQGLLCPDVADRGCEMVLRPPPLQPVDH